VFGLESSWRASEVISLWLGSLLGAFLGMEAGGMSALRYVEAFPADDPYKDIGVAYVLIPVGGFIGAVLVVWIALHVIHAPRAGVSALVCGLLLVGLVPLTAKVGSALIPFRIETSFARPLVVMIASLLSALVTYGFVTRIGEARDFSQPA